MSQGPPDRPRILQVFYGLGTGGTEKLIADLAVGLRHFGFHVTVGTFWGGPFAETIRQGGGDVAVLGASAVRPRLARMAVHFNRLRSLLGRDFDIVHTHSLGILWRVLAASLPRRSWTWVHTEHIPVDLPGLYSPWLVRLAPGLLRRPDFLTAVSRETCAYYVNTAGVAAERIRHVPNGVDVRRFANTRDRLALRDQLRIPPDAWLVGTVANLRPEKNHVVLLKALARVRETVPTAHLVLAGEGPLLGTLQGHAEHLGVAPFVHWLGARTDVPEILRMLDVFCLPSSREGMPLSILEAMAAGCPVVATHTTGTADIVEPEATGLLAPVGDTEKLTEQLLRVHDDPVLRSRLANAARRYVMGHARMDSMLSEYSRLYSRLGNT